MRGVAFVVAALALLIGSAIVNPVDALAAGAPHRPGLPVSQAPPGLVRMNPRPNSLAPSCNGHYNAVASPNSAGNNLIFGTAAISSTDVWAVGAFNYSSNLTTDQTLAGHWNGSSWAIVPTPNPGSRPSDLSGVAGVVSNDVWAVGYYAPGANLVSGFIEHWNGTSWTLSTTISLGAKNYTPLYAVTAISSTDAWVVGTYLDINNVELTLTEHWDGHSWNFSAPADSGYIAQLFSVSAFSTSDAWAVGSVLDIAGGLFQALAEHWNGSSWSLVSTPNLSGHNEMAAVNALEAGHAVAVGYGNAQPPNIPAEGEAWDLNSPGASTNTVQTGPGSGADVLEAIDRSGSSVWAVGFSQPTTSSADHTLAIPAAWDSVGHTLIWGSPGTSENPSTANNVLFAVSALSTYAFWAGGFASGPTYNQTLMELECNLHFNLAGWSGTGFAGVPFNLTLTAEAPNSAPLSSYVDTVHFSSTDPNATLPGDYTFTPGDAGIHMFTGVMYGTPAVQTLTVSDTLTPFISVTTGPTTVTCSGACQAPAGAPGGRGPGASPSQPPGPRFDVIPTRRALTAAVRAGASAPPLGVGAAALPAAAPVRVGQAGIHANGDGNFALAAAPEIARVAGSRGGRLTQPPSPPVGYLALLAASIAAAGALLRRRRNRFTGRSNIRVQP